MESLGRQPSCRINSTSVKEEHEFLVDKSTLGSDFSSLNFHVFIYKMKVTALLQKILENLTEMSER